MLPWSYGQKSVQILCFITSLTSSNLHRFQVQTIRYIHACISKLKTGWALKWDRKFFRFSLGVKQFVKDIFDDGEKTGKKANPVSVSLLIRNERDEYGNRIFSSNDWISSQQVRSLFAQFQMY